jgi:outer membrane protein OmpA-like peptidoglycan-associated protein
MAEPLPVALKHLQSRTTNPRLVVNERGRFLTSEPILFSSGLAQLRETSIPALNKLVSLLKEMPDIKLEVAGYTDNIGIELANEQISAQRAAAVKDYLISQGIDPSRLESRGMGSKDPIASNTTQLGRQSNRRIEFRITSPK